METTGMFDYRFIGRDDSGAYSGNYATGCVTIKTFQLRLMYNHVIIKVKVPVHSLTSCYNNTKIKTDGVFRVPFSHMVTFSARVFINRLEACCCLFVQL